MKTYYVTAFEDHKRQASFVEINVNAESAIWEVAKRLNFEGAGRGTSLTLTETGDPFEAVMAVVDHLGELGECNSSTPEKFIESAREFKRDDVDAWEEARDRVAETLDQECGEDAAPIVGVWKTLVKVIEM